MKFASFILIILVYLSSCKPDAKTDQFAGGAAVPYSVPDDSAITRAVLNAYACIGFKSGTPDYDKIRNYFIPQAQLINFRTDTAQITRIGEFIELYKHFVEASHIKMFHEDELFGRNEQFGKVAHRISTYITYLNSMDSVAERGVNSFQLIKTPEGWKVSSIIWDVEKKSLPVPAYYLK